MRTITGFLPPSEGQITVSGIDIVKDPIAAKAKIGYLPEADWPNAGIFVYQTFDFFASLIVPEHCTAVFLTHHVLAAFTAWMSLEFQMVHYYAVFFGGCSEISTIFLVLCDFDVYFPA